MALAALLGLALASAALASSAPVPGWGSKGEIAYKCGNDALCLVRPDGSGNRKRVERDRESFRRERQP